MNGRYARRVAVVAAVGAAAAATVAGALGGSAAQLRVDGGALQVFVIEAPDFDRAPDDPPGPPSDTGDKDRLTGGPGSDVCAGDPSADTFDRSCESGAPVRTPGAREAPDRQQARQPRYTETERPGAAEAPESVTAPAAEPSTPPESAEQSTAPNETTPPTPTASESTRADAPTEQSSAAEPTP